MMNATTWSQRPNERAAINDINYQVKYLENQFQITDRQMATSKAESFEVAAHELALAFRDCAAERCAPVFMPCHSFRFLTALVSKYQKPIG